MAAVGVLLLTNFLLWSSISAIYTPDWASLDTRPLPEWYDDAKFGWTAHSDGATTTAPKIQWWKLEGKLKEAFKMAVTKKKRLKKTGVGKWTKYGRIFMHWGVYSVPSIGSEWFWYQWIVDGRKDYIQYMTKNYKPGFHYADFGPMFTAELFDSDRIASIVKQSGAK
ncbi:unnamed protein product [Soboliphyme baturini]|uniref:alpha-L-fucosidase n=1 Tax=Soboliphyme baturini TaxID=241478 RepID=A0A183IIB7_9BILA|nr:unnamed protein product [Soboliphyme baturini]